MQSLLRVHRWKENPTLNGVNMSKYIKCGPAVFHLRDFCNNSPFSIWQWKLDPFITAFPSDDATEISFENTFVDIQNAELINREKDGFYSREVLKTESGTVHRLVRNSNSQVMLSFFADKSYKKISLTEDNTDSMGQAVFEFAGRLAMYSMIEKNILPFHGVLTEYNGKGIIITAPSETGKTTHARLWRDEKNALIINGDNACCYKENGKWKGFGIPWSGTSGECINRTVEIAALVILERGKENKVCRMNEYEAFCGVHSLIHYPSWDYKKTQISVDLCNEILKDIPAFRLECRPDSESVEVLCKALEESL